jgi:hypothetical protein
VWNLLYFDLLVVIRLPESLGTVIFYIYLEQVLHTLALFKACKTSSIDLEVLSIGCFMWYIILFGICCCLRVTEINVYDLISMAT